MKTHLAAAIFAVAAMALAGPAAAHEWLTGKVDPETGKGCCNSVDCHPQPIGAVLPVDGGFLIVETGEVFPASRVQWSPDGRYWRCQMSYEKATRCLFAPPMGS